MTATVNETGHKTFRGNGPIGDHRLVRVVAGPPNSWDVPIVDVCLADSYDCLGSLCQECFQEGDPVTVNMRNVPGTHLLVAAGAIDVGDEIYLAVGGRVAASGTIKCGIAMTHATQLGDLIEGMLAFDPIVIPEEE